MARTRTRVRVVDRGYNRLLRAVRRNDQGALTVGIHPREGRRRYSSGVTVAQVASWHSQGAGDLPVRDPLATWFDGPGRRRMLDANRTALDQMVRTGKSPRQTLDRAGRRFVEQVRATAARLRPLASSTRRQKRSGRILDRTGLLLRSYDYRVLLGERARSRAGG